MHFVNRFYVASFAASSFSNRPSFHFLLNDNIRGIRKVRTGHVHGCESLSKYEKENRAKSQHGPKLVKGVLWTNVFLGYGVVSPQSNISSAPCNPRALHKYSMVGKLASSPKHRANISNHTIDTVQTPK